MNKLKVYSSFALAFIINALIVSSIGTISVETRLAIEQSPAVPKMESNSIQQIGERIIYMLRVLPYKFSKTFGLLGHKGDIPEWVKAFYTFIITFFIALLVYHIFLLILGYKKLYKYFFGNLTSFNKINSKNK
jgi:hypothetical protein